MRALTEANGVKQGGGEGKLQDAGKELRKMMNLARLRAETGGFWNYCGCEVDMGVIQRDECYLWQQRESLARHWMGKALSEAAAGFNERQSCGSCS